MTYQGVVKGNVVVLEKGVQWPEGARVEVRVLEQVTDDERAVIDRILQNCITRYVGIDGIIEEMKREREERTESWLSQP